jgi:rod shape-determining protein MreD
LVVLSLQRSLFAELRPWGVALQVMLALTAGAGAGAGPERGALAGFVLGLMYDLATATPLGLTALVYGCAGFIAGYVMTITPDPQWWLAMIFVTAASAAGETLVPIGLTVIGQDGWVTTRMFRIVPVVAVFAGLISPLVVPLGRWCMCVKRKSWKAIPE